MYYMGKVHMWKCVKHNKCVLIIYLLWENGTEYLRTGIKMSCAKRGYGRLELMRRKLKSKGGERSVTSWDPLLMRQTVMAPTFFFPHFTHHYTAAGRWRANLKSPRHLLFFNTLVHRRSTLNIVSKHSSDFLEFACKIL